MSGRAMPSARTHKRATADGRCDCCMLPYRAGARLHLEHEKYWVLDVHHLPPPGERKKRGRA